MPRKKQSSALSIEPIVCPPAVSITIQPLSLNLLDASKLVGVSSWTLREAVLQGGLKAKRAGRMNVVLLRDLQDWLERLDDVEQSTAPSILARKRDAA